jgi:hypothetical protein
MVMATGFADVEFTDDTSESQRFLRMIERIGQGYARGRS